MLGLSVESQNLSTSKSLDYSLIGQQMFRSRIFLKNPSAPDISQWYIIRFSGRQPMSPDQRTLITIESLPVE